MKHFITLPHSLASCILLWGMTTTCISLANDIANTTLPQGDTPTLAAQSNVANSTDRIIVKYRQPIAGIAGINAISLQVSQITGLAVTPIGRTHDGAQILKVNQKLPMDRLRGIIDEIGASAEVDYAEPDLMLQPLYTPNDPRYNEQWHYYETEAGIELPAAWDLTQGEDSVVAVVDTGYLPHQDLLPNLLPGYDMIGDADKANDGDGRDADALDPGDYAPECGFLQSSWHGTHVAGTIAAVGNNGIGVTGVAFRANIVPVRVLGKCGGYLSDIADGIVWAAGGIVDGSPLNLHPANVINLSLGGSSSSCPQTLQQAIDIARQQGATIAVAAGNGGEESSSTTPANCDGVISVAATTRHGELASFSNFGERVDIAAPGVGILSTYNDGFITAGGDSYTYESGTSMSTPHVSGVAALLYAVKHEITPDEVEQILKSTTRTFPIPCSGCGTGILDAAAAVERASTIPDLQDPALIMLKNGVTEVGLGGPIDSLSYFAIDVPAGATDLTFRLSGGSGDADLYVRFAAMPTLDNYDCRPYLYGNEEICQIRNLQAGRYFLLLHAYADFSDTRLVATYRPASSRLERVTSYVKQQDYRIPDFQFNGISSPITVSREGESGRVQIEVDIKHPYIREISVELLDPSGQSHKLKGFGGAGGMDLRKTYQRDLGSLDSAGTWSLRVRDFGFRGEGYIDSWRITFP
jgi:serine protease